VRSRNGFKNRQYSPVISPQRDESRPIVVLGLKCKQDIVHFTTISNIFPFLLDIVIHGQVCLELSLSRTTFRFLLYGPGKRRLSQSPFMEKENDEKRSVYTKKVFLKSCLKFSSSRLIVMFRKLLAVNGQNKTA